MKIIKNTSGFSLVELVIVITIMAILSSLAMVSYTEYASNARDSKRGLDAQVLVAQLQSTLRAQGTVPIPDSSVILYATSNTATGVVGYQGYLGSGIRDSIGLKSGGKDPLNFDYTYMTNATKDLFELLVYYENAPGVSTSFVSPSIVDSAYATPLYSKFYPQTYGDKIGIIYQSGTLIPLQEVGTFATSGFDVMNGALQTNYVMTSAYQSCPPGWIGVPGSTDFKTSSFCVMKYEAKALNGGTGGPSALGITYKTHDYTSADTIVSNAADIPIATITQGSGITACQTIGAHLITNNEWMTIARNVEQNPNNWSSGQVGNGYMYAGHNDNGPPNALTASPTDANGYFGTNDGVTTNDNVFNTWTNSGVAQSSVGQRRTLFLSNGQIIWDLAGNVWEHVNGANTIDGSNYATMNGNSCGAAANWYNFATDSDPTIFSPAYTPCVFANGYSYASAGPKTPGLNSNSGIGRIYSLGSGTSQVYLRGGVWSDGAYGGVFALALDWTSGDTGSSVGFRCAR